MGSQLREKGWFPSDQLVIQVYVFQEQDVFTELGKEIEDIFYRISNPKGQMVKKT